MADNTNLLSPVTPIINGAALTALNPLPVASVATPPSGLTAIAGNATGTTGAVVGTLAAAVGKTTYISGFTVSAVGGVASVGPIVVAGLAGGSQSYNLLSSATGNTLGPINFNPAIAASATNTAITVTTTADGTATAVSVNSWGFQL